MCHCVCSVSDCISVIVIVLCYIAHMFLCQFFVLEWNFVYCGCCVCIWTNCRYCKVADFVALSRASTLFCDRSNLLLSDGLRRVELYQFLFGFSWKVVN